MGLALSAFAGGAMAEGDADTNFNATGMPIVNEKVVQKVVFSSDPVYTIDLGPEMYFFKEMEERTNVNFEFEKLSPDQWNERKNLMFAANELPDILMGGLSNSDVITYSQAGQLLPINDLVDQYMPDYKAVLEQFPESAKLYACLLYTSPGAADADPDGVEQNPGTALSGLRGAHDHESEKRQHLCAG